MHANIETDIDRYGLIIILNYSYRWIAKVKIKYGFSIKGYYNIESTKIKSIKCISIVIVIIKNDSAFVNKGISFSVGFTKTWAKGSLVSQINKIFASLWGVRWYRLPALLETTFVNNFLHKFSTSRKKNKLINKLINK